jgi:hypothetical protein
MNPAPFSRRHFISAALAGGAVSQTSTIAAETSGKAGQFTEPARDLPLANDADVIVCGAGPAGVTAAITAARAGAKVRLFEWRGCLGGIWTAGLLGYFLDFNKPGFAKELRDKLDARGARANSTSTSRFCYDPEALKLLLEELCVEAGVKFQYHTKVSAAFKEGNKLTTIVTMWHVSGNLIFAMMNHEYGIKPWDAAEVTAATVRARAEMNKMVNGLRALGGPWEGIQIVATAEQIGVRDGRRIKGRYTVLQDDLAKGARHDDAVVRVTFGIDVHALSSDHNKKHAIMPKPIDMKPYDIPLRALIAKDVDGLMMAGRCISGDFMAHSSYRVTGNAVAMGEAAGVTAALAALTKRMPHEVAWSESEAKLKDMGQGA